MAAKYLYLNAQDHNDITLIDIASSLGAGKQY